MEMEENVLFDYVDASGNTKKAEVLTLFTLEGRNHEYALCSVPADDGNFDIMTFIVNENQDGEVSFDDITDPEELEDVMEASKNIVDGE